MRGVDHHHVDARLHQRQRALEAGVADRGGGADQQAALRVLGGVRVRLGLLHVLDGDEAHRAVGVVDHDQPLDLVLAQEPAGLVLRHALADGDEALLGHQRGRRGLVRGLEAHVAVGEDADQLARAALDHREARDAPLRLDLAHLLQRRFRVDGERVDHHAALVALHLAHLVGLLGDREIAVQHPDAARLRHGDGEPALGDRVHGGRDERNVEGDLAGEPCRRVDLGRHHLGRTRFEQNIVEGEPFANLHETLRFAGRVSSQSAAKSNAGGPGVSTPRTASARCG